MKAFILFYIYWILHLETAKETTDIIVIEFSQLKDGTSQIEVPSPRKIKLYQGSILTAPFLRSLPCLTKLTSSSLALQGPFSQALGSVL